MDLHPQKSNDQILTVETQEANKGDQWHFGAFSCSSCGLSNSDDKKLSDWSKHLLEKGLKTPLGNPKMAYTSMSPQELSPKNENKLTYSKKAIASPKTPEELQSNSANILKYADNSQLQHSKSFAEFVTQDKLDRLIEHQSQIQFPGKFEQQLKEVGGLAKSSMAAGDHQNTQETQSKRIMDYNLKAE